MSKKYLIVEDDSRLRGTLSRYLKRKGAQVVEASTCNEAFEILETQPNLTGVLADVLLPDGQGFELVDSAAEHSSKPRVIIMTADDSVNHAIQAVQWGAADFLLKPFSFEALDEALLRLEKPETSSLGLPSSGIPTKNNKLSLDDWRIQFAPKILGAHPVLTYVFETLKKVADTDCSVLVTGESGTGKELIARSLHSASERTSKPFITVNCAAIPENLLESELFGHVKGAFTGATHSRVGRFQAADGGTIFLDEIGELPFSLQAKLLRVLQEKEITPVGESKTHQVDVRIVAATNRDLDEMVEKGEFREDLLYRLNVIPVDLPPLRERKSDITIMATHFIQKTNERRGRNVEGITEEALAMIQSYDWPGNIRQLENTIERMVVLASEKILTVEDLPQKICQIRRFVSHSMDEPELPEQGIILRDAVEKFENALIQQALERTGWNKNKAANILNMNRTTLVEKIKKKNFKSDFSSLS